jgi:hypothetical protein
MAGKRRFWLAVLACLAALALRGQPAFGGEGDEEEAGAAGDTTGAAAPGDTTLAALPDTLAISAARRAGERFSPSYTSKYNINRNTDSWSQTLNVGSWAGPVDVLNATSITIGRDRTLDRRTKNNSTAFTFGYSPSRELKITSALGVIRNSTIDAGRTSNTSQDTDSFEIESIYARRLAYGLSGNFRAEVGTSQDTRTDPLTSSRKSSGPHATGSAVFTAKRWADWSLSTLVRDSHLSSVEALTQTRTSDHNRQVDLGLTASFKVPGFDSWSINGGRRLNRIQYPFVEIITLAPGVTDTLVQQETNLNLTRDVTLSVASQPIRKMTVTGGANYRNNDINRVLDTERSQQAIDHGANARMSYLLGDSTQTELRGDWNVARSVYKDSSRIELNGDTVNRLLGASLRRPLGRRADLDLAGNYQLQQFLFDDTVNNFNDRDIIRGDASVRIDYRPIPRVNTYIRTNYQLNQTIFIDGSQSGTNQTQTIYAIYPTLEYQVTQRVMLQEEGSIVANATVFDFDENRNRLSRTTELRTTIDSQVLPRVGLNLRYSLRFQQAGSYRRGADGVRRFGKSNEDTSREVGLRINYTPFAGANTYFRTTLRDTEVLAVASPNPQLSEFDELEFGGQLNRMLSMGLSVGLDVKRFQSWTNRGNHNNYWIGSMNVSQKF